MKLRYEALDCPEVLTKLPRECPRAMMQIGAAFKIKETHAGLPEKITFIAVVGVHYDGAEDELILVLAKDARRRA